MILRTIAGVLGGLVLLVLVGLGIAFVWSDDEFRGCCGVWLWSALFAAIVAASVIGLYYGITGVSPW